MRVALVLMAALLTASIGQAHGYVIRAIPADRSALERPPTRLQYFFSEALEPRFSQIHLRDQSGAIIASGGVDPGNPALLTLPVPPGLGDGAYIVELRPAFASDGHVIAESRVFFVGSEVGGVSGQAADDRAIPLEICWRFLLSLGNMLFFGGSALYSLVLLPAWGSRRYADRGLPPRLIRRLRITLITAVALMAAANLIAMLQQTMVFFNAEAGAVLAQNLWQVVQIGSRFGDVWTLRMVLIAFAGILIFAAEYLREALPQLARGIWRSLAWLGVIFIGLNMITGHAAGSLVLPWIAIAVNWVHALAVAFWLGGIATLSLLLPAALQPYESEERQQALLPVMRRFSRIVTPLALIVIISGGYNALNYFFSPADLASGYGGSLGLKLVAVAALLILGGWQQLRIRPGLESRLQRLIPRLGARLSSLALLRLEAALAVVALLTVAALSATPTPEPAALTNDLDAPQATLRLGDVSITAAILPGGPGVNTTDILISRADEALTDAAVYLQQVYPAGEKRSGWQRAQPVEPGLYAAAGDEIDRPGSWWSLIDIVGAEGGTLRSAFAWQISGLASVPQSRAPNPLQVIALLALAAALAWALHPLTKRLAARMKVGLASALMALGAVLVSAAVMGFGIAAIDEQTRQYERALNPPPTVINSVLPDAESLLRGEAHYQQSCGSWQDHGADFRALRNRLDTARDDFLYAAVAEGWRDLPACAGDLSGDARWDIVNFVRTFEARE